MVRAAVLAIFMFVNIQVNPVWVRRSVPVPDHRVAAVPELRGVIITPPHMIHSRQSGSEHD